MKEMVPPFPSFGKICSPGWSYANTDAVPDPFGQLQGTRKPAEIGGLSGAEVRAVAEGFPAWREPVPLPFIGASWRAGCMAASVLPPSPSAPSWARKKKGSGGCFHLPPLCWGQIGTHPRLVHARPWRSLWEREREPLFSCGHNGIH